VTYQKEREEFIATMTAEGVPLDTVRRVLRDAATIQRLAEAECNGDYPCDNGERRVWPCARCGMGYVESSLRRAVCDCGIGSAKGLHSILCERDALICPSCRAQDRIFKALEPFHVAPIFSGDPRGACVKLKVLSGKTDDWGRDGICVPTR
jgi:hypothetical protein